jgi:hypothetical protein
MSFGDSYGFIDRTLHRLAFKTLGYQAFLADMESSLFAKMLAAQPRPRPIFICGLPRCGTTLLLNLCHPLPEFASHTYRDMPFVLLPLLWNRFSSRFKRNNTLRERSHQDGIMINADSPEAFEEMLWMAFWDEHYTEDHIMPWDDSPAQDFTTFFEAHMRKVIAVRRPEADESVRYLSKNNLNICRIPLLLRMFPEAVCIVPFREPTQHAAASLRQHQRFRRMQSAERFIKEYMAGIGHFDFGENLKPINLHGWLDQPGVPDPSRLSFWLTYWLQVYSFVADRLELGDESERICLVSYEALCQEPEQVLESVAHRAGLGRIDALMDQAASIRPAKEHAVETHDLDDSLLRSAGQLQNRLCRLAQSQPG